MDKYGYLEIPMLMPDDDGNELTIVKGFIAPNLIVALHPCAEEKEGIYVYLQTHFFRTPLTMAEFTEVVNAFTNSLNAKNSIKQKLKMVN